MFKFFEQQELTPDKLRELNQYQLRKLATGIGFEPVVPMPFIGGFLALGPTRAAALQKVLRAADISTDYRGDRLRLGPAPYVTGDQLDQATAAIGVPL